MGCCRVKWDVVACCVCFQAEDGIRDLVRFRGLGDVYKRQERHGTLGLPDLRLLLRHVHRQLDELPDRGARPGACLLYTSDAADERSSVDLGGRRIIKKKKTGISTER